MKTARPASALHVCRILETSLYTDNLDQAERFYTSVLGLRVFAKENARHVFFKLGEQMLLIFNPARTIEETEIAPHGARGAGHVAFAVPMSELDGWKQRLQDHGVEIEQDMVWPNGARSLYFRDPAQNCLELTSPRLWEMEEAVDRAP